MTEYALPLDIIPVDLFNQYQKEFDQSVKQDFDNLTESDLSIDTFSFYTSVSAVFSSKIEGEQIELDSFIKHKRFGTKYLPDYTRKIDDLYDAYSFAQHTKLSANALMDAHKLITRHILQIEHQGKFRNGNMFVLTDEGKIEYVAASPHQVETEMQKLFNDISVLIAAKINFEEAFYFASMLHLNFIKIHPFDDGNGRTARLLEKWFLAEKLGKKAWFLQSEKYYYLHHKLYYKNIRLLGLHFDELNYKASLPFLQMLPQSAHLIMK